MATRVERRRFSVHDYHRMAEAGILSEDDRVELLDGEIVEMSPIGSRHAACVNRLDALLQARIGADAVISVQNPVRLGEYFEPQPDVAILRPRDDYYALDLPGPTDVFVLIEVAETSVAYDREVKLLRYAAAGIPEVWLVDLVSESVEQYTEPAAGEYHQVTAAHRGETLVSPAFPTLALGIDALLG